MDSNLAMTRIVRSLRGFARVCGRSSPGARLIDGEGLTASIVPATPERSVFNAVVWDQPPALLSRHGELSESYREAAVRAWTVWVPPGSDEVVTFLERHGHKLDAEPRAMLLELDQLPALPGEELDWSPTNDAGMVGSINDAAHGARGPAFAAALQTVREPGVRLYVARHLGEAASCVLVRDVDDDCGVFAVATRPEHRGRGLASRLLAAVLGLARTRGCRTATLQSTRAARGVYQRLGFHDHGPLAMWEHRH